MSKKKNEDLPFADYQDQFGKMYHLTLYVKNAPEQLRFVHYSNQRYTTYNGYPIFYSENKEFCMALDYTIVFPKIYVRRYRPISEIMQKSLQTAFFH